MALIWSRRASAYLTRVHAFLAPKNARAAADRVRILRLGVLKLKQYPRLGERIENIETPETRRIFVSDYEVRYQVVDNDVTVLRIFHTRVNR
jgi:plasmid stabilization system protein ParE